MLSWATIKDINLLDDIFVGRYTVFVKTNDNMDIIVYDSTNIFCFLKNVISLNTQINYMIYLK